MASRTRILVVVVLALAAGIWMASGGSARAQQEHPGHDPGGAATQAEGAETAGHGQEAAGHSGGHEEHGGVKHLTNWVTLVAGALEDEHGEPSATARFLTRFQAPIFSAVAIILLGLVFSHVYKRRSHEPGRLQMAAELVVGGLYNLFEIILGPHARRFVPYLGTLFLFILVNNLMGIIPLMGSSTSTINTTVALAVCTFLLVQGVGIKENGLLGYLHHMAGSPRSAMDWGFSILLFPLHLLGEFIKPMSLSLRLFGNIFGEDALIATMVVLGAGFFPAIGKLIGVDLPAWLPGLPYQFPFVFLAMLTSTIQALVFALLSTVYIALMLPHEEHEAAHGH
jgi:F-type H+-transporting ATPase subunit a